MNKQLLDALALETLKATAESKLTDSCGFIIDSNSVQNSVSKDFVYKIAELLLMDVLKSMKIFDDSLVESDYGQGLLDAQTQICNAIKIKFGVKNDNT